MDIICLLSLWLLLCIVGGAMIAVFLCGANHLYRRGQQKWLRDLRQHDDAEQMEQTKRK